MGGCHPPGDVDVVGGEGEGDSEYPIAHAMCGGRCGWGVPITSGTDSFPKYCKKCGERVEVELEEIRSYEDMKTLTDKIS